MKTKRLYVDLHVLQTMPPSCVNRDDMGSPKTAIFGGATRARVSSQAWKRAMRLKFCELFSNEELGKRTVEVVAMVVNEIKKISPDCDAEKAAAGAAKALTLAGLKIAGYDKDGNPKKSDGKKGESDKKKNVSEALFFFSNPQARAVAKLVSENDFDVKKLKEAIKNEPSFDMVLFGRMVAGDAAMNYDAVAQVAHCISTHAVTNEYDYFVAVDDYNNDTAGAAHLGTVEFNSATLYRYATVNVGELAKQLGEDAPRVLNGFVNAFVSSIPTGKLNTFANNTTTDIVYVAVREDQPVNLCGAFEAPVAGKNGYVAASIDKMLKYAKEKYENFVDSPVRSFAVGEGFSDLAETLKFKELLKELEKEIKERIGALKE